MRYEYFVTVKKKMIPENHIQVPTFEIPEPTVRIICAAVRYQGPKMKNPLVLGGYRHANCMLSLCLLSSTVTRIPHDDRGFLTSDGDFVSRADAWKIAKAAGQVQGPETGILTSEDLY